MKTEIVPTIELYETSLKFRYLWLKYVNGFDLSVHCAKCLLGSYSKYFKNGQFVAWSGIELDEHDAKYYYLCGVTVPYDWSKNLHLAFVAEEGSTIDFNDGYTHVVVNNARQIPIRTYDYKNILHGNVKAYNTCRNWRFAYEITNGFEK